MENEGDIKTSMFEHLWNKEHDTSDAQYRILQRHIGRHGKNLHDDEFGFLQRLDFYGKKLRTKTSGARRLTRKGLEVH